jgi:hypothetical protein
MRICYLIQTHKHPQQVSRLISRLQQTGSDCFVLVIHDFDNSDFPAELLRPFANVHLLAKTVRGIRGDFSLVQSYLNAIDWLFQNQIGFDWLINLSGQDYPTQSTTQLAAWLATCPEDGLFEFFEVFSTASPWGIREGEERYLYQYWRSNLELNRCQKAALKPLQLLINSSQPWLRLDWAYGLSLGIKAAAPFKPDLRCYGGSFFKILSYRAVRYLQSYVQTHPDLTRYYLRTRQPDESFMQTVLLNAPDLKFSNANWMYYDFSETQSGHPRNLNQTDYAKLIQPNVYFARKFEPDSEVLDLLDRRIFDSSVQV